MRKILALVIVFITVVSACSSDSADESASSTNVSEQTSVAPTESTSTSTSKAPAQAAGTLVSATDGGVVTFGDVTLTIAPGALAEDTEIRISAVPESEWPEELTELTEDLLVAGDFLRLEPDGLVFLEPAILSRRVDEIADVSDGEVSINPAIVLSRSGAEWQALETTIVIGDNGASVESAVGHFSNNVLVYRQTQSRPTGPEGVPVSSEALIKASLTPLIVARPVGGHFVAKLTTVAELGSLTDPWEVTFSVDSGPLVLGVPSRYRTARSGTDTRTRDEMVVRKGVSSSGAFPAAYRCTAVGEADFSVEFRLKVRPVDPSWNTLITSFSFIGGPGEEPPEFEIWATLSAFASCYEDPDDLLPGLFDVGSEVESDPAGHSCCVPRVPRQARMTLGSLWLTDSKLGDDTAWQGLFFDRVPGSADDVMPPGFDGEANPPNTVEVILADDFDESGRFTVEGVGRVAGFSNIRIRLDAVATDSHTWSGTLTKGVDGGLPTGQAIVYNITGNLIAPRPIAFVDDLARAFREGDSQFLLDHLHPELLRLYGGACVEFVEGLSSPDLDIKVHSFVEVFDWTLSLDGHDMLIDDAVRLDVTRTENGNINRTLMHVAPRPSDDGMPTQMTWFADCGDPLLTE